MRKGSVSYGVGADFSLPHCFVGDKVSENSLEPSPAGISDLRAEISWCIVMVTAFRQSVQEVPPSAVFFSFLSHFVLNMPCERHSDYILVTG